MRFPTKGHDWAAQTFGGCDLGDNRRLDRLIDYAGRQAENPSGSIPEICKGDEAAQEGVYRFLRNTAVRPSEIESGICAHTASLMNDDTVYLAIQDSTAVSFSHAVAVKLKEQGTPSGFMVHATLVVDAKEGRPIGLIDQDRWIREEKSKRPGKRTRALRPYHSKESFRWESARERVGRLIGPRKQVITVCDREADIYDFLAHQTQRKQRFVVRASHDRALASQSERLWNSLSKQSVLGQRKVTIEQRGGQRGGQRAKPKQNARSARQRRVATVDVRTAQLTLRAPKDYTGDGKKTLRVHAVYVSEPHPPTDIPPISWMLLTSEPISTFEDAEKVVEYYASRWLIEEYFKAWKTGCRIELRPLQEFENIERMLAVTSAIAVRILQLRSLGSNEGSDDVSCECVLSRDEWQCLHAVRFPQKRIPKKTPSMKWAHHSIGRLAGWTDTKRTGVVGWQTLWKGWNVFQQHYIGWHTAKMLQEVHR